MPRRAHEIEGGSILGGIAVSIAANLLAGAVVKAIQKSVKSGGALRFDFQGDFAVPSLAFKQVKRSDINPIINQVADVVSKKASQSGLKITKPMWNQAKKIVKEQLYKAKPLKTGGLINGGVLYLPQKNR